MGMRKFPTEEEFVSDIEAHLEANEMSPSEFGKKVLNDSSAISRIKEGTDVRMSTGRKIYGAINGDKS